MAREDLAAREQRQRPAGREGGGHGAVYPGAFQATAQAGACEEEAHRVSPPKMHKTLGRAVSDSEKGL